MSSLVLDRVGVKIIAQDRSTRWVIQGITTQWKAGERIGLMGHSGSGKTTLMRVMAGLVHPTQGRCVIKPRNARVFLVLQRPEDQFIYGSVGKQVAAFSKKPITLTEVEMLLTEVGLSVDIVDRPLTALSSGQQRLVAIACALAGNAAFIMLDEPMVGLDYNNRQLVSKSLLQLANQRGIGLMSVSHHPDDLLGMASRLWILQDGQLCYDGLFANAPVNVLQPHFSSSDTSLYFVLRQLEALGFTIAESTYDQPTMEAVESIIQLMVQE